MNRKQKFGFIGAHMVRNGGLKIKGAAKDAVSGACLLGRFARSTVSGSARSVRNAASDVAQGAKYGWRSAGSKPLALVDNDTQN